MWLCRYVLSLLLLIAIPAFTSGQSMYGLTLGNYAGVNNIGINPSGIQNSKTWLDVQFFGMEQFVQNNFLYQKKSDYSFSHFFQGGYHLGKPPVEPR